MTNKLTAEECRMLIDGLNGNRSIREDKYLQALEIALPELEQQGGWISCSERMPVLGSTILVHMEDPIHSATPYAVATYDKYGFSRSKVTHWQPLPAPPQPQPSTNPQIDNDGWIEWGGGYRPVPERAIVAFRCRDGYDDHLVASEIGWSHKGSDDDIIAYRVIENNGRQ